MEGGGHSSRNPRQRGGERNWRETRPGRGKKGEQAIMRRGVNKGERARVPKHRLKRWRLRAVEDSRWSVIRINWPDRENRESLRYC